MKDEEIVGEIKAEMRKIDDVKIHFTLKKMKLSRISSAQVRSVKIFLALREMGLNIVTTNVFYAVYGKSRSNILTVLHLLGDKGVLTWIRRNKSGPLRYMLSEKFLNLWNPNIERKDLNKSSGKD